MNLWTAFVASWPIWVAIAALAGLAITLDVASRDFDPYVDREGYEPSRLDLMDAGRCGAISPEGWICDRAARHDDDIHADSTKGGDLGRARWAA